MKTSNKILLGLGVAPFILIFIMLLSLKNVLDKEPVVVQDADRSNYHTEKYDLGSFEEINAEGVWEIVLSGGDNFKIELDTPPDSLKYTSVTKQNNKLFLFSDSKHFNLFKKPRLNITLPSISVLDLKQGSYNVDISNLKLSRLNINIVGMANIKGTDSSVEELYINGNGIVSTDLAMMPVTNAYFNFNGLYRIMINMNGGEITGLLNGPGKLTVEGEISKNTVKTDGSYTIPHDYKYNRQTP